MRIELEIGHRLYRTSRHIGFALIAIIVSMTVMIVSLCVVVGFKQTICEKVSGFGAHIRVTNFENNNTYEMKPVEFSDSLLSRLRAFPHVESVTPFITKPGILKTDDAVQGVVVKAWQTDSTETSLPSRIRDFAANLTEGRMPQAENEVVLSSLLAERLGRRTGERMLCYFVGDDNVRARKVEITGLYATGFSEGDMLFVIGTMPLLRRLNGWSDTQVCGVEVMCDGLRHMEEAYDAVYFATCNRLDDEGNAMYAENLQQLNPQIFSWLDLLDMNVVVILVLMMAVCSFSIISALIILILSSVRLIGTLKALGATNEMVRRVFLTEAMMLVGRGMLIGNLIGLGLCAVQYYTHLLPLEASTYYVNFVPIAFPWLWWLLLNIAMAVLSLLIMLAPGSIVSRISPAVVMRFE